MDKFKKLNFNKVLSVGLLIGLILFCYFFFFHHLTEYPLRLFDESRNAVNALEMTKNHNYLVTYFNGRPDMWNVKPPLFVWLAVGSFKIFGANEFALRFPAALSASVLIIIIYFFCAKFLKNQWIGLLADLIIFSAMGFSDIHIARSGDFDALLTLCLTAQALSIFLYLQTKQDKYLYYLNFGLILAVLTKGVAGLFFGPGILLYLLISKKYLFIFKQLIFWQTLFLSVLIIVGYYLSRNLINPGYLAAVYKEELGRFSGNFGSGSNDFWYYLKYLNEFRFQHWVVWFPITISAYFFTKEKILKQFILFIYLLTLSYFLLISFSSTKQLWYDAPLYPLASLSLAMFFVLAINKFPLWLRFLPLLVLLFYLQRYLRTNYAYIMRPDLEKNMSCIKYGYLFRQKSFKNSGYFGVHREEWCTPILFYLERDGLGRKNILELKKGDKFITCDDLTYGEIEKKNKVKLLFTNSLGCWGAKVY